MNNHLPVLFLAFANSPTRPLAQLTSEENSLRDILHDRAVNKNHFQVHRESHTDLDSLRKYLTEYRDRVWLFHYAGHAESKEIMLTSGDADAGGIASMLSEQANLKLVFLNGCSTRQQVSDLLGSGIPAVIATRVPVNDHLAAGFSRHFYEAMALGSTVGEAFEAASGYVQSAGKSKPVIRGFERDIADNQSPEEIWSLFHLPEKSYILDERLPEGSREEVPDDFEPNDWLIEAIWNALVEGGVVVSGRKPPKASRKRMDILNNFPAPVAEHLRKLFVPLGDADEGYNKISPNRLRQLARTYQVMMELLTFTLLAQLWELRLKNGIHRIDPELGESIQQFLNLKDGDRETFAFIPFIRQLRLSLDAQNIAYFVEELADMAELVNNDSPFRKACVYMDLLRNRLAARNDLELQENIGRLCIEAEEHLSVLFSELGFLAGYTLATVKQIVVQKYRHTLQPRFQHIVVRLVDLLGGMDDEEEVFDKFLDSQSVLLLKEDEASETIPFLNLSPFIIDENAFVDNSDVSKIYFYHHRRPDQTGWAYRWVHKPNDPVLWVPGKEFGIVQEQIEAFMKEL